MVQGANFIDGSWVPAASGSVFERRNPADPSDVVGTFPASGPADVSAAVDALEKAAPEWAATSPERRAAILGSAADHLESRAAELIAELVREEGKTVAEAKMEVGRTPANLRFYAGEATRTLGATYPETVRRVVLPHVAPALLAGGLMAFTISFNEFILAFFLTGGGFQTLPIYIYSLIRWEASPIINAAATVMLVFAGVLVLLMYWLEGARALRSLGRRQPAATAEPEDDEVPHGAPGVAHP